MAGHSLLAPLRSPRHHRNLGVIKHLGENPHRVLEKGLNLLGFVEVYTSRFLSIY